VGHLMGQVGRASLAAMDDRNARRRANGLRLAVALADTPGVAAPPLCDDEEAIFMSFPILVDDPDDFAVALLERGVDTARGYMSSCARLPMFASDDATPRADAAQARMLHVPIHPALGEADIDRVAATIREALAARGSAG
jgi:perosamine synthetase